MTGFESSMFSHHSGLQSLTGHCNYGTPMNYILTFKTVHPNIVQTAIALSGFSFSFKSKTMFTATIVQPVGSSSASIIVTNLLDDDTFTITSLQYTVLVVEATATPYIDVQTHGMIETNVEYTCTYVNTFGSGFYDRYEDFSVPLRSDWQNPQFTVFFTSFEEISSNSQHIYLQIYGTKSGRTANITIDAGYINAISRFVYSLIQF